MAHEKSSVHRALSLPEVVNEILKWIDLDEIYEHVTYVEEPTGDDSDDPDIVSSYQKLGVLARCALVNKFWFDLATPYLWRDPTSFTFPMSKTLPNIFAQVEDPVRRQLYASHVKEAIVAGVESGPFADDSDRALEGLEFPNLSKIHMPLAGWDMSEHIPKIGKNGVKVLEVDPSFDVYPDTYRVCQDEMNKILDQIPELFPDLEELTFLDSCLAEPGSLERCSGRLPKLKKFNHSCVIEHLDYPPSRT